MEQLFYTSCLIYICTAILCGVIRWFHMCRPFDEEEAFFYPARKLVAMCYWCVAMQLPYLIFISSPDTWLYIRVWGVVGYGIAYSYMFQHYFRQSPSHHVGQRILFTCAMVALVVMMLVAFGGGNILERYSTYILAFFYALGAAVTGVVALSVRQLKRDIDNYHNDNFSNETDFPYRFARRIIMMPIIQLLLVWLVLLTDSRWCKLGTDIINTFLQVVVLIAILHPQRSRMQSVIIDKEERQMEKVVEKEWLEEQDAQVLPLADDKMEQLYRSLRQIMEKQQPYLDPHVDRRAIGKMMGCSHTYVSQVAKHYYGSFYVMISYYRIAHARRYRSKYSGASDMDTALACGFDNVRAYRRAVKVMDRF